jgi:hypothetical protein
MIWADFKAKNDVLMNPPEKRQSVFPLNLTAQCPND